MTTNGLERRVSRFFKEHLQRVETCRGIVAWMSVDGPLVGKAFLDRVDRDWLNSHQIFCAKAYSLTTDEPLLPRIRESLESA